MPFELKQGYTECVTVDASRSEIRVDAAGDEAYDQKRVSGSLAVAPN